MLAKLTACLEDTTTLFVGPAAMAAAMLMVSGPSEAKMHAGKAGSSSESSEAGYDMTGMLVCFLLICCQSNS